jgi:hypothetical protein
VRALKLRLGLDWRQEFKWNSASFTREQREKISAAMLRILAELRGFLVVVEGTPRARAVPEFESQVRDYCLESGRTITRAVFDEGMLSKQTPSARYFVMPVSALNTFTLVLAGGSRSETGRGLAVVDRCCVNIAHAT